MAHLLLTEAYYYKQKPYPAHEQQNLLLLSHKVPLLFSHPGCPNTCNQGFCRYYQTRLAGKRIPLHRLIRLSLSLQQRHHLPCRRHLRLRLAVSSYI